MIYWEHMNKTFDRVLALDIGGTNTRMGLVDKEGSLTAYRRLLSSRWNGDRPLEGLANLIAEYLLQEASTGIAAVSLGFPSAVDKSCRILVNTPTIPSLDGAAAADILEKRLGFPVYLDRDVVMLYTHAARILDIPKKGLTLGFFIGTGIGNLIVLDGSPLTGFRGVAGELGHIPLHGKSDLCGCGKRGCAELYAAGHALVRLRERFFPGEDENLLFTLHRNSGPIAEYVDTLAEVLSIEMIILDPEHVLLGGGVIQMPDFPVDLLKSRILSRLRGQEAAKHVQWFHALDAQRAGVIGAGLYAFQRLMKEIDQ